MKFKVIPFRVSFNAHPESTAKVKSLMQEYCDMKDPSSATCRQTYLQKPCPFSDHIFSGEENGKETNLHVNAERICNQNQLL